MRILLTNDDGIMAEGIHILAKELEKEHEVIIIAPDEEKSAQSQAITLGSELIVKEVQLQGLKNISYSISGTPADCVRVGFDKLIKVEEIDLVVSGTNRGSNAGMDILYSGTVSAAIEANIYGKPSIAISAEWKDGECKFDVAARYASIVINKTKDQHKHTKLLLNVNTPFLDQPKAIKVCRIGDTMLDYYVMKISEEGVKSLQVKGRNNIEYSEGTDRYFLNEGYVTITPLHYDLTNFDLLNKVDEWIF